jgi:hypothetical protein
MVDQPLGQQLGVAAAFVIGLFEAFPNYADTAALLASQVDIENVENGDADHIAQGTQGYYTE